MIRYDTKPWTIYKILGNMLNNQQLNSIQRMYGCLASLKLWIWFKIKNNKSKNNLRNQKEKGNWKQFNNNWKNSVKKSQVCITMGRKFKDFH